MPTEKQLQRVLVGAKQAWAADVRHIVAEIETFATAIEHALGEISRDEALLALRRKATEVIDQLR